MFTRLSRDFAHRAVSNHVRDRGLLQRGKDGTSCSDFLCHRIQDRFSTPASVAAGSDCTSQTGLLNLAGIRPRGGRQTGRIDFLPTFSLGSHLSCASDCLGAGPSWSGWKRSSEEPNSAVFEPARIALDLWREFSAQLGGELLDRAWQVGDAHPSVTKSSPKTGQK